MDRFTHLLMQWYAINKRDLPWRGLTDPYLIWISEIILQQTRVEQGIDYYAQFIQRFPNVQALALAEEDEVLKYWQGLGYYSRARNMHAGARYIMEHHNGIFPQQYQDILRIKGVGSYTAAAIASIAYNMPYAAIDGNVYRVLSRIYNIDTPIDSHEGKTLFAELAQQVLDTRHAGTFNQAMMDFGSLQCKPATPLCHTCPMSDICLACKNHTCHMLPVKEKKVHIKKRFLYYLCVTNQQYIYLQKRKTDDIWAGLYEFPLIESDTPLLWEHITEHPYFIQALQHCQFTLLHTSPVYKHQLTHQLITGQFFYLDIQAGTPLWPAHVLTVHHDRLYSYPVSRLMEMGLARMP